MTNHHAKHARNGHGSLHASEARARDGKRGASSRMLLWAGLGLAGAGVALALALAGRERRTFPLRPPRQRSFLSDALRQIGLVVLGVLARRVAQSMPLQLIDRSEGAALSATEAT